MGENSNELSVRGPNIFDYATKELSQDAFICWLIQLADCEGHELQTASKEFIALLCRIGGECKEVSSSDVGMVKKLSRQVEAKIDVFFIADIKGCDTCFIIEDKVNSCPHSGQLQKYNDHVRKKYPTLPIVKIYFKSGYLFEKDRKECEKANYGILDYNSTYSYLDKIKTQDVIFNLYRDYIRRNFVDKYNGGLAAIERNEGHLFLNEDFVQYEFLRKISHVCQEVIGDKRSVKTGTSFGDPWAEYDFVVNKDFFDIGKNEYLTYRIEPRKSREKDKSKRKRIYCLSIRHYAELNDAQQKKIKLARLKKYKAIFKEISERVGKLSFSPPLEDRTGSYSSEIGLLFFNGDKNSMSSVLEFLPVIHKDFITKIQQVNDVAFQN